CQCRPVRAQVCGVGVGAWTFAGEWPARVVDHQVSGVDPFARYAAPQRVLVPVKVLDLRGEFPTVRQRLRRRGVPQVASGDIRCQRTAAAYACMRGIDEATRYLAKAGEGWEPHDAFERAGADFVTAGVQRDLGQLDTAERLAASAVRGYGEGHYRRGGMVAGLLLAEIHVRAGEPRGLTLAHHAIEKVSVLQSVAARREWLIPLATALEARPGTDTQELAQKARQFVATRI
ncbi:MAG: hypothetical protein ACRDQX_04975, partial [Pseudonocardiaceae bacterium]